MSYIGQGLGQGKAERFIYTASGSETSVTLDDAGRGIAYTPGQVDVYLNGVKLVNGTDFTATSGSSITGLSALAASDVVEIVALDAFSPADTVSASTGGTFAGNTTFTANLTSTGTTALQNLSTTNSALNISSSASDGSATIDASGNLLVGKTSTSSAIAGTTLWSGGASDHTASGTVLGLNRLSTDGDIVNFKKDGTTVGSIGTATNGNFSLTASSPGTLVVGVGDTALKLNESVDAVYPGNATSGDNRDGSIDLGRSAVRFKNLYLSGGVYLGGTGSANYLDDYEEGTWTPTFTSDGGTTGTVTGSFSGNTYTKIGNQVLLKFKWSGTLSGFSGGTLRITGLPFNASVSQLGVGSFECYSSNTNSNGSDYSFYVLSSVCYPRYTTGTSSGYLFNGATIGTLTGIYATLTYTTNS